MGAILIPLIVISVVLVLVVLGTGEWVAKRTVRADELARPESTTLDYLVPTGQDPAAVMTALSGEGYDAVPQPGETHLLHIACPAGEDRERAHVRATIASVRSTAVDAGAPLDPGTVRFVDEARPGGS